VILFGCLGKIHVLAYFRRLTVRPTLQKPTGVAGSLPKSAFSENGDFVSFLSLVLILAALYMKYRNWKEKSS
jgi:hypothetical protein